MDVNDKHFLFSIGWQKLLLWKNKTWPPAQTVKYRLVINLEKENEFDIQSYTCQSGDVER